MVIIKAPKESCLNIGGRPTDDHHLRDDDFLGPLVSIKIATIRPKELGDKSPLSTIQNPHHIIYVAQID
jgi:hypothetical protein